MLLAVVPFATSLYFLFAPPQLEQTELLLWLIGFAVLTRFSMTFYAVPWNAMFAEMSEDYEERSILLAYRFAVAWIGGILFTLVIYSYVFAATDAFPQGQLNPSNYPIFALCLAVSVGGCALATTWLTWDQIPYLPQPVDAHRRFNLRVFISEISVAFQNRDFRILVFAVLASGVVGGTNNALQMYVNTYFWGLDADALRYMALTFIGGFIAFVTIGPLQSAFDKKRILVTCALGIMAVTTIPVTLRFIDVMPENGSTALVAIIIASYCLLAYLGTLGLIMFASMVADAVDVQEYQTGLRQEGLFNSAMTFSGKVTTAGGVIVAGLLVDYVLGLEGGTTAANIDANQVVRLGVLEAYVIPVFNLVWLVLVMRYSLTREKHHEISLQLRERNRADSSN